MATQILVEPHPLELYKKFRNDFGRFSKYFFPNFIEDKVPEFHKEIYDLLRRENRLVVAAPRGYAKSTIGCVLYPLWCGLLKVRKEIHIISASEEIAVGFLRKVKMEIDTNEKVRSVFGDVRGDKWNEGHIELKSGVSIKARGAGGQSRGPRPDCILLDDIETDESVVSEEQRKKLKEWLFKACLNSLTPDGQIAIFGTIIHPLSVLADLLDMPNGWHKRKFKAYVGGIE